MKPFSGKVKENVQIYLNPNLVIVSFSEKVFELTLNSKNECSERLERSFFCFFFKFLSDEVETIFSESKTKCSKLFKSKFAHRKLLRKWI